MRRLPLLLAAVIPLTGTVLAVSPAMADAPSELIEDELLAASAPDGTAQTILTSRVINSAGEVLSTSVKTLTNPKFRAQNASAFPCVSEGDRPGFVAHNPREAIHQTRNDLAQFLFFPFSADNARVDARTGEARKQWLICGTGGADANNGSRTVMSGPGIAFRDRDRTYKLGQIWKEGKPRPATPSTSASRCLPKPSTSRVVFPRRRPLRCGDPRVLPSRPPSPTPSPATVRTAGGRTVAHPTASVPGGAATTRVLSWRASGNFPRRGRSVPTTS